MVLLAFSTSSCALLSPLSLIGFEQVPNLSGLPLDQATLYLEQAGLTYQITYQDVINQAEVSLVIGQSPQAGSYISPNKSVEIIVGRLAGSLDIIKPTTTATQPITRVSATAVPNSTKPLTGTTAEVTPTPETSTPSISPSPEGPTPQAGGDGRIAFASDRSGSVQIWLVKLDGSDPVQLTDIAGGACQPEWSPDGSRLVFINPCNGNRDVNLGASLWLINADGTGLEALPSAPGGDFDPAWSPDGSKIAFTSIRDNNLAQVYMMDISDRSVSNLSSNSVNEMQPAWSPDGRQLVFVSSSPGSYTVFIRMLETGNVRQFSREENRSDTNPLWTPDGNLIIYNHSKADGVPALLAGRLEDVGFNPQRIYPLYPMPMRDASVSPDGLWIAFESWLNGINHDIWIGLINGAQPQPLTVENSYEFDAAWQP